MKPLAAGLLARALRTLMRDGLVPAFFCDRAYDGLGADDCVCVVELLIRAAIRAGVDRRNSSGLLGEIARLPGVWRMTPDRLGRVLASMRLKILGSIASDASASAERSQLASLPPALRREVLRSVARILLRSASRAGFTPVLVGVCRDLGLPGSEVPAALETVKREFESWEN